MKAHVRTAGAVLMLISGQQALFAQLTAGTKDTIFVGPVRVQESVQALARKQDHALQLQRVSETLGSQLIHALSATRVFQVVERARKDVLELEQSFADVYVNPDDKNLARLGMMAGAKFVMLPEISGFEDRSRTLQHQRIGRASTQRRTFLSASVRIADTTTGQLLPDVPSHRITKTETIQLAADREAAAPTDELLVELAREMAAELSRRVISLLRPPKVLTVTGQQALVNRGTGAGFAPGVTVEFFATEKVVDEDTGEAFLNEIRVGSGTVVRSDPKKSFVRVEGENLGVAKGCIARPKVAPAAPHPADQTDLTLGRQTMRNRPERPRTKPETPGSSEKPW